ncbi:MAG: fimbrillin family protein, partial [Bacteroidales bacterium]|nr:fimbrillin family protein [Bacteroidales bacterium]
MKKLLTLAAVVAAAASCAKEPFVTEPKALEEKEFSASFSDFGTKTSIAYEAGVYKVNWISGDEIAVFDNVDPHTPHIFTASGDGATTTFSGSVNAGATEFYAVYPASSATTCDFDKALVGADIPAFQSPAAGGVAQDALVTVAHTTTSTFFFQHVCSMIKFNISGTEGISAVKIQANGDEMIAGRASVTIGTEPTGVAGSSKSVTITPDSGSTFASGTYYAAILPADYASGISVTLGKEGAGVATKKGSIGLNAERCKGTDLGTLAGWTFGKAVHITSAEDLQALWKAGGCADLAENDVVYLDTDVELTKSTRSCEDSFPAIFDGQGHTITVTYAGSA